MAAPNGLAEQELVSESCRNAGVSVADVDFVESHGYGSLLGDVVEVTSLARMHRPPDADGQSPLPVTSVKTQGGHTMECCGITSLLKVVYSAQFGRTTPNLHLRQLNPYLELEQWPVQLPSEGLDLWRAKNLSGVLSKGFNGTNGYCIAWGALDTTKVQVQAPPPEAGRQLSFWPGGGGELKPEVRPSQGYFIVGSWTEWRNPARMEEESCDVFGYTVTIGANGWEQFQIWLDGNPQRVLHPGRARAPRLSPVLGPDDGVEGLTAWQVDGSAACSRSAGASEALALSPSSSMPLGQPGERYRVRLSIAGKWRSVDWERLELRALPAEIASAALPLLGRYYVTADWNDWDLDELRPDAQEQGLFSAVVELRRAGGAFQIVRNRDWSQVFHPSHRSEDPENLLGPDDGGYGLDWCLGGSAGDRFRLEFRRSLQPDAAAARLSWLCLSGRG